MTKEQLKNENEVLRAKNKALEHLTNNCCTTKQYALIKYQQEELERMLKYTAEQLHKTTQELLKQMEYNINLRDKMYNFCKNNLIYFIKDLKNNAVTEDEKAFCKKMQPTINYLIFNLNHTVDKFRRDNVN